MINGDAKIIVDFENVYFFSFSCSKIMRLLAAVVPTHFMILTV